MLGMRSADSPVSFHAESPIGMVPASIAYELEFDESLSGNNLQSIRIDPYGDGTSITLSQRLKTFLRHSATPSQDCSMPWWKSRLAAGGFIPPRNGC